MSAAFTLSRDFRSMWATLYRSWVEAFRDFAGQQQFVTLRVWRVFDGEYVSLRFNCSARPLMGLHWGSCVVYVVVDAQQRRTARQ